MSTVYFRQADGQVAELRGTERHWAAWTIEKMCKAAMPAISTYRTQDEHPIGRLLADKVNWPQWKLSDLLVHMVAREPKILTPMGEISGFALLNNTALLLGSDALKVLVHLHAACEVYTWIAGKNRKWFAGMLRRGRAENILRSRQGWEGVIEFLEQTDASPVVLSYSVCDSFPSAYAAGLSLEEGERQDWNEKSFSERWDICMARLVAAELADVDGCHLEMKPENWDRFWFGPRVTIMDLVAADDEQVWEKRVRAARES